MNEVRVTWDEDGGAVVDVGDGIRLMLPPEIAPKVVPLLHPATVVRPPWWESFEAGLVVGSVGAIVGRILGHF